MDVSFTNVLEGARQYFQGLPAGTGSSSGSTYSSAQESHHDPERNIQIPSTSAGYWPAQHDSPRVPPREQTPTQRPPSHQSDTSRPASHQSQAGYSTSQESPRIQGHNPFQSSYQEHSQHPQSFQFSRPHSREAPSNAPQSQAHQHYQPHIIPTSSYHPTSSPQQPRIPSRHSEQNITPSASQPYASSNTPSSQPYHSTPSPQSYQTATSTAQSYHPMQTQSSYQNYQQSRSFYPPHTQSQTKAHVPSSNAEKTTSTSQHYGLTGQDSAYYKGNYPCVPLSQNSARIPNQYDANNMPSHSQNVSQSQQDTKYNYTSSIMHTAAVSKGYSATHNLPPIASLSSVNYLSSRNNRDIHRPNSSGASRTRTLSGSSNPAAATSTMNSPMPTNTEQVNYVRTSTAVHHQSSVVLSPPHSSSGVQINYSNTSTFPGHTRPGCSQSRSTNVTTITQSYNHAVMTTSTLSSYNMSVQQQSSGSRSYYHPSKGLVAQPVQTSRIQPSVITSQQPPNSRPEVLAHVDLTGSTTTCSASAMKIKRESPLDLSVKTVRTSADSTHEDMEHDARQKSAVNFTRTPQPISTSAYSTYDISNSFQRNINHRPAPVQNTASAPKVDFLPDFSLTHAAVQRRNAIPTVPLEKPHLNQKLSYENIDPHLVQPYPLSNRYPTASVPSAAHVNSYIHTQSTIKRPPDKLQHESLPRIEFPSNSYKPPNAYVAPAHDVHRKRTANTAALAVPNKILKVDNWKQTIDQEIEQRFSTYKQQQEQRHSLQNQNLNRPPAINGYNPRSDKKQAKDMFGAYQRTDHLPGPGYNMYQNTTQYQSQTSHSQTYVPTVAGPHYPSYSSYNTHSTQQQSMHLQHQPQLPRTHSNPSLNPPGAKNNNIKNTVGGAANKHVLSLLRNSLEIKGAKEAQRKLEQEQSQQSQLFNKVAADHLNVRTDVQQPSTDVTAPLQPKPGLIVRQNVSPFTPTNLPETNYNTTPTPYKLHLPRAIDSVNFDTETQNTGSSTDKQNEHHHIMSNHNASNTNSDLDGLAAFLAARIRTKAELKQVGPSQPYNTTSNLQPTHSSGSTSQLQEVIENQLKTPIKEEQPSLDTGTPTSNNSSVSVSPPKLTKEKTMYSPRRKLFSRNEDEQGCISKAPPRDTSGLRSSSETSIFDFPDSESDGEMPILERQSLEDMRRDRKSGSKSATLEVKIEEPSIPSSPVRPPSPGDDIFDEACNNFMEQLKTNVGKKRGRRKKGINQDVLAKLEERVTQENPIDEVKVKVEIDDSIASDMETTANEILAENIKSEILDVPIESPDTLQEDSDTPLSNLKKHHTCEEKSARKDNQLEKSTKKNNDTFSSTDAEKETPLLNTEIKQELTKSSPDTKSPTEPNETASKTKLPEQNKKIEVPLVIRPAKKPTFGDGSDFYPGWEEEVCKYKKSLRMPPSLIQISRPPQSHRLSTSLPDLDRPQPYSPGDSHEFHSTKTRFTKIKSEPIDSESESNSSFNLYNAKNNYDSEGSCSVISLPNTVSKEKESSFLNKLFERYGGHKKRKHKKKDDGPKIIPKSESDLLPTPSLEIKTENENPKKGETVIANESALLGFRTKTIETFKETFIKAKKIVGVNEHLTTVVLNTRTRKETKVLKQRATIKEVFGEDRPASAPPDTCVNEVKIKQETRINDSSVVRSDSNLRTRDNGKCEKQTNDSCDPKQLLKNSILNRDRKRTSNLYKTLVDKKIKTEFKEEREEEMIVESVDIKRDPDTKSETPSLDGDESGAPTKKKSKFRNMRRKCSSGFDYIRKKKRQNKKENLENDPTLKPKKRPVVVKATPESVQDIQKEIKSWVLNKGIGETHLHRAARLGYTDVTVYCLEKMDCSPSPKDNAGYTPLHEACSRGHLDIAKLLLAYGANPSESAQGGIRTLATYVDEAGLREVYLGCFHSRMTYGLEFWGRSPMLGVVLRAPKRPLHEAVENGFVEIVRLLLSYGVDPMLATYAGLTPLALASEENTRELLENHLADIQGASRAPWLMYGPASCFDPRDVGYNILDDVPLADPVSEEDDVEFEVSDVALPNLYTLHGEPPNDRWMLLQDLSNLLKIKSRDALLRQICGNSQTSSSSSSSINYKSVLRELKMSDFLEQAHCCQFLNAGEKVNTRASKIALVKYTDKVKELLKIEKVVISLR